MKLLNLFSIGILMFSTSCNSQNSENTINSYFKDLQSVKSVKLPEKLNEVSGIVCAPDGRIFVHNDEKSVVYQIDYKKGKIIKNFTVGKDPIKKDFEDIAIANGLFYLVTSEGDIYEFPEGEDNKSVKYEKYKTFLDADNDVEGLCYDPENNSLLLACKRNPGKEYKGNRAVYEFSLENKKLKKKPRFLLPVKEIMEKYDSDFISKLGEFFLIKDDTFAPSGIERHPKTGNFFIISFKGRIIIEVTKNGEIINQFKLDPKRHQQPEGITFTPDLDMLISDEAAGKKATITVYNLP